MVKFVNAELKAGNVSLKLVGGVAVYKIHGYALSRVENGVEMIVLQPEDLRKNPVMKVCTCEVESLEITF